MKLRKLFAMTIAAIMAVSTMAISVSAEEKLDDAVVSVLATDGVSRVYLTQADIDNGKTEISGYNGITVEVVSQSIADANRERLQIRLVGGYSSTTIPTSTRNLENAEYSGTYNVPIGGKRYSEYLLLNKTNTRIAMNAKPTTDCDNEFVVELWTKEFGGPLIKWNIDNTNTQMVVVTGINQNHTIFAKLENNSNVTANGSLVLQGLV